MFGALRQNRWIYACPGSFAVNTRCKKVRYDRSCEAELREQATAAFLAWRAGKTSKNGGVKRRGEAALLIAVKRDLSL